jgi:hypothetical protein
MPEGKGRFEPQGAVLLSTPPDQFDQIIRSDAQRYSALFKEAN